MNKETMREIERLLRRVKVRIANSIARAVVQVIDDQQKMQTLQIGAHEGEDIDDAERFQNYGFSSVPLAGAEAVAVFPNGDRSHPLVVAVDDRRHRIKGMSPGEVAMYSDEGDFLKLARGKLAVLVTNGLRLGSASAAEAMIKGTTHKVEYDTHFHLTPFGPTQPPSVPMASLSTKHKLDS